MLETDDERLLDRTFFDELPLAALIVSLAALLGLVVIRTIASSPRLRLTWAAACVTASVVAAGLGFLFVGLDSALCSNCDVVSGRLIAIGLTGIGALSTGLVVVRTAWDEADPSTRPASLGAGLGAGLGGGIVATVLVTQMMSTIF